MPEYTVEVNGDGRYGAPITNGKSQNGVVHVNGHLLDVDVTHERSATAVATLPREHTGNACKNCGGFDLVRTGTCDTCSTCGSASGGCA
jgi:hypothetical protein